MARQDAQKRKASRSRLSSKKGPCHSTRIASVSKGTIVVVGSSVGGKATSSVGDRATSR
jgi:hypothetical protein